ncbi:hypothetical protein SAMN04487948_12920 [Halogranum amylolyticum]|uniref:Phage protein D n=1 Tax=Halogranum amylolyticum TaxID=660520 RepID=A0A1H8WG15_9EURY|nr:contractile injection system protein, VgrG/Pvc8 family [Halogranum amylolyticum]SEP26571.1 hypothetical protein SAMN04487948_12920 [Halogranum amylolyticum]
MQYEEARAQYGDFYRPQFRLVVGPPGSRRIVREYDGVVSGLKVDATLDGADQFSFTLVDAFDLEQRRFVETVWQLFDRQTPIRIELGYDSQFVPVLHGQIQSIQPEFPSGSLPTLAVSGYDRLHELTKQTGETDFRDMNMVEIVASVVERYGFTPTQQNLVAGPLDLDRFRKLERSNDDYEFLRTRANRYNFELFTRVDPIGSETATEVEYKNRLYFRPSADDASNASGLLTLLYGESLHSFSLTSNEANQLPGVVLRYTDRRQGLDITKEAPRGADPDAPGMKEIHTPVTSAAEGQLVAEAEYDRLRQERVTGNGTVVGLPNLRIGELLELGGLGRFDGTYYVTGVTHRIDQSGYTTDFRVRLAEGGAES